MGFTFTSIENLEQSDLSYQFDMLMQGAQRHSRLLIDLSQGVTLREVMQPRSSGEQSYVEVIADVKGIQEPVVFRTVQGPSGRWRVLQVIVAGGDEMFLPWSIPSAGE
jgi:hypothetical protein